MAGSADAARALAESMADVLIGRGGIAVWLAGSHARGEADELSDLDLGVIVGTGSAGPGHRLEQRRGRLVSVSWITAERTRQSFADPAVLGAAVPGWRRAVILRDPEGAAADLKEQALRWSWAPVAETCERWVAEQVTGYAEEVHKLLGARLRGRPEAEAVQRAVLALRLPIIMSVHRRMLYDSENTLWAKMAAEMGDPWASAQGLALGADEAPPGVAGDAALRLYRLAADETRGLRDARQEKVVAGALALIERAR